MIAEANLINRKFVTQRRALFQEYDGFKIPYVNDFFNRVMTVNTIYFWNAPSTFLKEMYRVLKPGGICVITFVDAEFMKKPPFVNEHFQLYTTEKIEELISLKSFELSYFLKKKDRTRSKSGTIVDRHFTIAVLKKVREIRKLDIE